MSFSSDLSTFNGSAASVARNFSGGVFDSMNQRLKATGTALSNFSGFCAGIKSDVASILKDVKKILPKGIAGLDEEMRNFDREIGWDSRSGTFYGAPSSTTVTSMPSATPSYTPPYASPSYTPPSSGSLPTKPSHRSSSLGTTTRTATAPITRTASVSVAASAHPASAKPMTPSASITTTAPVAMTASITTTSPTRGSGASALWKNYQESFEIFRTKMFPALRYCGIAYAKVKEVAAALDVALRQVSELNALLGRKFDVDEFNRKASEVQRLISVHQKCGNDTSRCVNSEEKFLSGLEGSFRRNIAMARNRLEDMETKLGRRPGWMKSRLALIDEIDKRYQSVANQVNANLRRNNANISRLNNAASELTRKTSSLGKAKDGEDARRSSIQSSQNEANKALQKARSAHMAIVPKSRLSFTFGMSGSRYVVSPSKGDALNEEQRMLGAYLGQLESAAARLTALQKPTERLTASDINSTDAFPAFIVADACTFAIGGRTYYVPIPTAFPLTKPRRFADASEIAPFLLRLLCALPAGSVQITIIEQAAGGANGSVFNGLKSSMGTFRLVPRIDELHSVLKEHGDYIADLASSGKFGATDRTWAEYNSHHPKNPLPCKILVVYSFRGWDWQDVNELGNLIVNGATSGVNVLFSEDGIAELDDRLRAQAESWAVARNPVDASKWAKEGASLVLQHIPMRMPPNTTVGQICNAYIDCLEKRAARAAHVFNDLFDGVPQWSGSSIDGIEAVIGWDESGSPVHIRIGGDNQHGLIGGKTGGGKSNLIHVIICSLCHRYSPEELQICLLDMKDGVEAFRYLDDTRSRAWLPHARAILASDSPHFASTFLDEISRERENRNDQFKRDGAVNISGWRRATGKKMPRILVIADEFTRIFADADSSKESARKLADLLNLGRSCGIHVLLATQNTDSLVTSNASVILSQTTLRLALPEAKGVLSHGNTDAETLVRPQAILNEFSGAEGKNIVFKHPFFDNETRKPTDVELYRSAVVAGLSRVGRSGLPVCRIVDGVSLQPVPPPANFRTLLGPEPPGARPRFNLLLGRTDDFSARPFLVPISGDAHNDHLLIVAAKDPENRKGVWGGLRVSVLTSLSLLPSHQVLFYNPLMDHPFRSVPGLDVLGADADENTLKAKLDALKTSKAKHRIFVVENFDRATFLMPEDADPFGGSVDDSSTAGIFRSAFDRKNHAFSVVLFARDSAMTEEMLGDKGWRCMSHRIAFGQETPTALRSIIKGTEMLDNPGQSIFYSAPTTGGGFRTFLPFIAPSKGGST